jgi:hypothetical protein
MEALHGPDAREALRALFPQGLQLTAAPDYFRIEASGIVETSAAIDQAQVHEDTGRRAVQKSSGWPDTVPGPETVPGAGRAYQVGQGEFATARLGDGLIEWRPP